MQSAAAVALMPLLSFAVYTAAVTPNAFQWARQPQKVAPTLWDLDTRPLLTHGSLG